MSATTSPPLDEERLNALLGQAVVEFGATVNAALVVIGDRLGLYRELAAGGPYTSAELAARTGTSERYVREWLGAQAASGWVTYHADGDRYGDVPGAGADVRRPEQPRLRGRRLPDRARLRGCARAHRRGVRDRHRLRLGRASPRRLRGLPALLRARLPREHRPVVDPGARRRRGEAAGRRPRGRHRLRPRRLLDHHRRRVPAGDRPRHRRPRGLDRRGAAAGGRGGGRRPRDVLDRPGRRADGRAATTS